MPSRDQEVVHDLKEIIRLAGQIACAGGPSDELGLRNRATEIAAMAETLVWVVDPAASDWNLELYDRVRTVPGE